jgi:murein DD-endopeptidase MepM/ murein hydrolase activator NlpD
MPQHSFGADVRKTEPVDETDRDDNPLRDDPFPAERERAAPQRVPGTKPKPSPVKRRERHREFAEPQTAEFLTGAPAPPPITAKPQSRETVADANDVFDPSSGAPPPKFKTERESRLNPDDESALRFSRSEILPQGNSKRPKQRQGKPKQPIRDSAARSQADAEPTAVPTGANTPEPGARPQIFDNPEIPRFAADAAATVNPPLKAPESPLKSRKDSKLQFAPDEAASGDGKPNRKLAKSQAQADKLAQKLETAKSKLPAKRQLRSKIVIDEKTGKPKRKLYFESEVKSQSEHLKGAAPLRPVKAAGNSALMFAHTKVHRVERENVGTEAAHKGEIAAEGAVRSALRSHKLAPYRKVEKLERTLRKSSVKAAYQKALAENPKLKSNVFSRMAQKRKIKKDYAKTAREAKKTAERAKKAGSAIGNAGKAVVGVVKRHPVGTAAVVLIALLLFALTSLIGAFGGAGSGGLGGILTASYLAEDEDIDAAELAYTEWETDLQMQVANTETAYPGYDEYRYNVGEISHNPFELMAYLTVKYQNFTSAAAQAELAALFGEQYNLTFTPSTETRYADPTDANEDGDYEPYEWSVLTVALTARNFSDVAASHLSGEEAAHYALLLQTKGARQYLANPFGDTNWLPYVTSYYGYRIHPIRGEKNYHTGIDIGLPQGTEIHAGQDGAVTFAGYSGDYGNVVVIENADGLVSKYAHCDTLNVTVGQIIKTGDVIATVGSTGASTGAHLHLEILKNGSYVNPIFFADTGSFSLTPSYGDPGTPMGDGSYAALIAEAEKYLGFPYVWGGSSPATSFDCSGFVSYVLRASGVKDVGRLGATGLYNVSTPVSPSDARPGDLIFYHSTYSSATPVTHVGFYVGTDATGRPKMLHCGNPIQYAYIDTPYWQQHFFAFGRIN